jgi:hypothetical protein
LWDKKEAKPLFLIRTAAVFKNTYSTKLGQGAGGKGFFSTIATDLADGNRVGEDKNPSWGKGQMTKSIHFA